MRLIAIAILNGFSVAALYFTVASGFTLTFGLMRTVNLAYGSLFLFGGYAGWEIAEHTKNWYAGAAGGSAVAAIVGIALQQGLLERIRGQDLRQALVTIGIAIVAADLMLAGFGGLTFQFTPPDWMQATTVLPIVGRFPMLRLALIAVAMTIGACLWLTLTRTKIGLAIRAAVDDREMLAAIGTNPSRLFLIVAGVGAALAGLAGVIGGTALSISPGEDSRYLLASLVVTIVGGMGSLIGAAIGALAVGLLEQFGVLYFPNYSVAVIYGLMVAVLALRPQGLMGRIAA